MTKEEIQQKLFHMYRDAQEEFMSDVSPDNAERTAQAYENWLRLCDLEQAFVMERLRCKRMALAQYIDDTKVLNQAKADLLRPDPRINP